MSHYLYLYKCRSFMASFSVWIRLFCLPYHVPLKTSSLVLQHTSISPSQSSCHHLTALRGSSENALLNTPMSICCTIPISAQYPSMIVTSKTSNFRPGASKNHDENAFSLSFRLLESKLSGFAGGVARTSHQYQDLEQSRRPKVKCDLSESLQSIFLLELPGSRVGASHRDSVICYVG